MSTDSVELIVGPSSSSRSAAGSGDASQTSSRGDRGGLKRMCDVLGPGIMFASSAIGVSHLVQCTRSGALYGWANTWAIVASLVLKYPFYEFALRYTNVTGTSLIEGYRTLGCRYVSILTGYIVVSCPIVQAAVGATTGAFVDNLIGLQQHGVDPASTVALLYLACALVLLSGRYALIDGIIKVVTAILVVCTLAALVAALAAPARLAVSTIDAALNGSFGLDNLTGAVGAWRFSQGARPSDQPSEELLNQSHVVGGKPGGGGGTQLADPWDDSGIRFLVALMGWMPIPMDTGSLAGSLWAVARIHSSGLRPTLREALAEFGASYLLTAALAFAFLTLAVRLLHDSGETLPDGSAALAAAVVHLYSRALGGWALPVVGVAASCAMAGTCLTLLDAYMRILSGAARALSSRLASGAWSGAGSEWKLSAAALLYVLAASYLLQVLFPGTLPALIDLSTTVSFVVAPLVGAVNMRLVTHTSFPPAARPSGLLQVLAWAGLAFLAGFTALYMWTLVRS